MFFHVHQPTCIFQLAFNKELFVNSFVKLITNDFHQAIIFIISSTEESLSQVLGKKKFMQPDSRLAIDSQCLILNNQLTGIKN